MVQKLPNIYFKSPFVLGDTSGELVEYLLGEKLNACVKRMGLKHWEEENMRGLSGRGKHFLSFLGC